MRKVCVALGRIGLAALAAAVGGCAASDDRAAASALVIDAPAEGALLGSRKVHVSGHVGEAGTGAGLLTVNGTETTLEGRRFAVDVEASGDGSFAIDVAYGEVGFPAAVARRTVDVDATPPDLDIEWPPEDVSEFRANVVSIRGRVRDPHLVEVLWNGRSTRPEEPGTTEWRFSAPFVLPKGHDVRVEIEAVDAAGNRTQKILRVLRAVSLPPATAPEAGVVAVRIAAGGELDVADAKGAFQTVDGNLASVDPIDQDRAVESLRGTLIARTQDPALREPDGSSRLVLDLHADAGVRWRWVHWVFALCADPQVMIYRCRFEPPDGRGAAITQRLWKYDGAEDAPEYGWDEDEVPAILVSALRMGPSDPMLAWTKLRIASQEWLLPTSRLGDDARVNAALVQARGRVFDSLCAKIADLRAANPELTGEIETPPPKGPAVPYEDVWGVMHSFASAGLADVAFVGAAAPLPKVPLVRPPEPPADTRPPEERKPPEVEGTEIGGGTDMALRRRGARRDLRAVGAGKRADEAVEHALQWLAAHQSADGGWEAAGWSAWCAGKPVVGNLVGQGKQPYDAGVTGLALLAFMGAGYTHLGDHPFADVVRRGLRYLKNAQDAEGWFGPRAPRQSIYDHAIAALAMVEAYGMTGSPIWRVSAQKALDFIAIARNPYFAWRYGVKPGENDTSITGWMATVLRTARWICQADAKDGVTALVLDEDAFAGVEAWIDKVTDPDSGRVGYQRRGTGPARPTGLEDEFPVEKSESLTAVGILQRVFLGQNPWTQPEVQTGAELCSKLLPTWNPHDGTIDMYYWFYGTLAMFQVGGEHWKRWDEALKPAVVDTQRLDGDYCGYKGSWDPVDPWGPDGGRVYSTAILALCLEGGYRYERVFAR